MKPIPDNTKTHLIVGWAFISGFISVALFLVTGAVNHEQAHLFIFGAGAIFFAGILVIGLVYNQLTNRPF